MARTAVSKGQQRPEVSTMTVKSGIGNRIGNITNTSTMSFLLVATTTVVAGLPIVIAVPVGHTRSDSSIRSRIQLT